MAMTPKAWSVNALSVEFSIDRRTVAKRLSQAGLRPPYRLEAAARVLLGDLQPGGEGGVRTCRLQLGPRQVMERLQLPLACVVPWSHSEVMDLDTYQRSIGLDPKGGEIIDLISFGFPLLPPAPGERLARVSKPHADLWRALFSLVIGMCGGNPEALHLGEEARRIRGLPLEPEAEPAEDA